MPLPRSLSLLLILLASPTYAAVKPHALFCDHAVLQRNAPVPVWGFADKGETVTVEFLNQKHSTVATDGLWKVVLQPLDPGGPFTLTIRGPSNTITLNDIVVGDVWLCSGQSNMGWAVGSPGTETKEQIATHANDPMLRFFHVPQDPEEHPKQDLPPDRNWTVCTPHSTYSFSAVGYYFGRDIRKATSVPIGLISSVAGGTFAHTWMPAKYLEADPAMAPLMTFWDRHIERYKVALDAYKAKEPELRKKYEEDLAKAKAEGKPDPKAPQPPESPDFDDRNRTAGLYNGMIHPLQPYAIRGALWYQGENDAGAFVRYRVTLPTMIRAWRETWG